MYELIERLKKIGHEFAGILLIGDLFTVYAFDPWVVSSEPLPDAFADQQEYRLRHNQWKQDRTYILFAHRDFNAAVLGAIGAVK